MASELGDQSRTVAGHRGKLQGDEMVLAGAYKSASGEETLVRGIWKPVSGNVRERAVTSTDDGRTWKPWFDLLFRPRVSSSDGDDGKIIARLDRQYQAAVQQNDAATMGRILADDFVLVTGSGKTHTRAELLAEARSGQMVYEYQEDAEQAVHVLGRHGCRYRQVVGERDEKRRAFRLHPLVQ